MTETLESLRAALREAEGRAGQAEREAKGLRGELHDAMRGWSDAQQDARRYLNERKAERERAEREVDEYRQALQELGEAAERAIGLLANSDDINVNSVALGLKFAVDEARDALRVEQPREVSAWEFACGCSINSYGRDAEPMLSHGGCRVLSKAVKRPPSGIRVAEPEREDWQAIQKQVDGTARKHREAAERGQTTKDPAG